MAEANCRTELVDIVKVVNFRNDLSEVPACKEGKATHQPPMLMEGRTSGSVARDSPGETCATPNCVSWSSLSAPVVINRKMS